MTLPPNHGLHRLRQFLLSRRCDREFQAVANPANLIMERIAASRVGTFVESNRRKSSAGSTPGIGHGGSGLRIEYLAVTGRTDFRPYIVTINRFGAEAKSEETQKKQ
jgi:hypothetical protein